MASVVFSVSRKTDTKVSSAVTTNFADAETYLANYATATGTLPETFSLAKTYPLLVENQEKTNLCWVYAAQKSLESCLMVETNEYHNFSEYATAIFAYYDDETGLKNIDSDGTFERFNLTTEKHGLVFESDFSNDNMYDVTKENVENYSYVFDLATKNISHSVKPVKFMESTTFAKADLEGKKNIIKRFIQEHGGLYVGLEPGAIRQGNNGIVYTNATEANKDQLANITNGKVFLETGHAATIIGYNQYGFVAMNSWGVESNSYDEFYIPYDYLEMYNQIFGYVHIEHGNEVELSSTTASNFSTNILASATPLKNMFTYGENVNLVYNIHEEIDFEAVFVNIFKGGQDLTSKFTIEYDDNLRTVSLTLNTDSSFFAGGTYVIRVYEDINLVGTESFTVYTGTEVAYFKLNLLNAESNIDSYAMLSSSETSETVMTFYVSATKSYQLNFFLTSLNSREYDGSKLTFSVTKASVYFTENGEEKNQSLNGVFTPSINNNSDNKYAFKFDNFSEYAGKRLEFVIRITSPQISGCRQSFYVNFIVSNFATTNSSIANSVEYMLDGGINSPYNVLRYPKYSNEGVDKNPDAMTKFILHEPTKFGHTFMGWYTDPTFAGQEVFEINSVNTGDLVLYARWEKDEAVYFETSLAAVAVFDYSNLPKTLSQDIIYGDSVVLEYHFKPLSTLSSYNYLLKIYYYINDVMVSDQILQSKEQSVQFYLNYPELVVGNYEIRVVTAIVVTHQFSISENVECEFETHKKQLTLTFDNAQSKYTYDGEMKYVYTKLLCDSGVEHTHNPIANAHPSMTIGGVYVEDHATFEYVLTFDSAKNFGSYRYAIASINNDNYAYDESAFGVLVIEKKVLGVEWMNFKTQYDSTEHSIGYKLTGVEDGDIVSLTLKNATQKNAGVYTVEIESISNENYTVDFSKTGELVIEKAKITLELPTITERLQIAPGNRKQITYEIKSGTIYGEDQLNIVLSSEGLTSTKSGTYEITGISGNDNYEVIIFNGKYILTGYYYVYYTLPNGEIYKEIVADGKDPKGINKDIYEIPIFHTFKYSQELKNNGEDLYITVEVKNYTWVVIGVGVVVVFVALYWFATRKARRNRVS